MTAWAPWQPCSGFIGVDDLAGVDPHLAWADATGFAHHARAGAVPATVPMWIELARDAPVVALEGWLRQGGGGAVRPIYALDSSTRWCIADITAVGCRLLSSVAGSALVRRFGLALPVLPHRPPRRVAAGSAGRAARPVRSSGSTLVGVIDDGCPFANAGLHAGGKSRLLAIWDQDPAPAFDVVGLGDVPAAFGYGRQVDGADLVALFGAATDPVSGVLDEDRCYELSRYPQMRARRTHGGMVLGLLAMPTRPQRWAGDDRAGHSGAALTEDLAFVQLPRDAWADPTGSALIACVLDGLRYLLAIAGPATRRIVANVSCSIHAGPHNGTGPFERAVDDLVGVAAARGIVLDVYMPVGNTFQAALVAEAAIPAGSVVPLTVQVAPDGERPLLLDVWIDADGAEIVLEPPGGPRSPALACPAGQMLRSATGVAVATVIHTASVARGTPGSASAGGPVPAPGSHVAVFIGPTCAGLGHHAAPAGRWTLTIRAVGRDVTCRASLHRNDDALGAPMRGRPSRLIDPADDPARYLRAADDDVASGPGTSRFALRRRSTISECVFGNAVHSVAAEMRRPPVGPSPYSSAEPVLSGRSPAFGATTDETSAVAGVLTSGTHGGSVVRAAGTSLSTAWAARYLVGHAPPAPRPADGRRGVRTIPP